MNYGFNVSLNGRHFMGGEFRSATYEEALERAKELARRFSQDGGWKVTFEVTRNTWKSWDITPLTTKEDLEK